MKTEKRTGLDGLLLDIADVGGPGTPGKTQHRLRTLAFAVAALGAGTAAAYAPPPQLPKPIIPKMAHQPLIPPHPLASGGGPKVPVPPKAIDTASGGGPRDPIPPKIWQTPPTKVMAQGVFHPPGPPIAVPPSPDIKTAQGGGATVTVPPRPKLMATGGGPRGGVPPKAQHVARGGFNPPVPPIAKPPAPDIKMAQGVFHPPVPPV